MHTVSRDIGITLLLVLWTCAAFWPVRDNDFVIYDDQLYITRNPVVQSGLNSQTITWAFTSYETGNWHPLTWLSHMVDTELFGAHNPRAVHAENVALHALNVVMLFVLLRWMTGAAWLSAIVALLFAIHPLRVESVAWAAERKDVLSALFALLAMLAYVGYARRFSIVKYIMMIMCFTLSLMAKPMFVTLPFLLLLLDYWPLRRIGQSSDDVSSHVLEHPQTIGWRGAVLARLLIEKVPLLMMAIASSVMTYIAQKTGGAVQKLTDLSIIARIENAMISYTRYIGKFIWPSDLVALYPQKGDWPMIMVLTSIALLMIISVVAIVQWRRKPHFIIGWLWFVGTLVPVIGLVQVGSQSIADRYTYFPTIGLLIMVVWSAAELARTRAVQVALAGAAVLVAIVLSALTWRQTQIWRNAETLYTHALNHTSGNWVMHMNLGLVRYQAGDAKAALEHFEESIRIKPDSPLPRQCAAHALVSLGRIREAMSAFQAAIERESNDPETLNNFAWLLATNPDPTLRDGVLAVTLAERACDLTDNPPSYLDTLAAAYAEAGRFEDAIRTAERARTKALETGQHALARSIADELQFYRGGKPFRAAAISPQTQ